MKTNAIKAACGVSHVSFPDVTLSARFCKSQLWGR